MEAFSAGRRGLLWVGRRAEPARSVGYTDIKAPRYVGIPERDGLWVEADKYDAALVEYNACIKAEDEAARQASRLR